MCSISVTFLKSVLTETNSLMKPQNFSRILLIKNIVNNKIKTMIGFSLIQEANSPDRNSLLKKSDSGWQ